MNPEAEPVTRERSAPLGRAVMAQGWKDAAFLHWALEPERIAPLLPPGTRPDTHDDLAYVGLIAFQMVGVGGARGPGIPYFGTFCETNVRLYSVDEHGRRGVVFRSMDAARLLPVLGARASLQLPYLWSRMRLERSGDVVAYSSRRHLTRRAAARFSIRIQDPIADPTPLEDFLTARWALHTRAWGRTLHVPNEHPRWPLHRASVLDLDERLLEAAGLPAMRTPPVSVLFSPGVTARFGLPHRV